MLSFLYEHCTKYIYTHYYTVDFHDSPGTIIIVTALRWCISHEQRQQQLLLSSIVYEVRWSNGDYGRGTVSTTPRFSRRDPASKFTHSMQAASAWLTQRESWRSVRRPHCDSMIDARFGIAILSTVKSVTAADQNGRRNDRRRPAALKCDYDFCDHPHRDRCDCIVTGSATSTCRE